MLYDGPMRRADGLHNCLTGMGVDNGDDSLDTTTQTRRGGTYQRSVYELENEWQQSWMAYREVSQLPYDMFREGFSLVNVEPPTVDMQAVREAIWGANVQLPDGQMARTRGINWFAWQLREQGDKVGGAALYAVLDDGLDPSEPLDLRRVTRLVGWEVFDRSELNPWAVGYNVEPIYYVLSDVVAVASTSRSLLPDGTSMPDNRDILQPGDVIHASRLQIHKGRILSRRQMRYRRWWGASVLELNERERRGVEESSQYLRTYADRASWLHLSMAELQEVLGEEDDHGNPVGEQMLQLRLKTIRKYARTLGIVVTDGGRGKDEVEAQTVPERKGDKLESVTESTGDLTKIAEWDLRQWARGTGMPADLALNEEAGGLSGGDNKGSRQRWNGQVRAQQTLWGTDVVDWMLRIYFSQKEGPTQGMIPKYEIVWNPLYIPTPAEQAELDKLRAEADKVRIDSDVASARDVAQQRLVQGDQHGPLRAEPDDQDSALGAALVGIASQMLEGAVAVGEGLITPEFFSLYLQSIDGARFPSDRAEELARSVAADAPTPEVAGDGTTEPDDLLAPLFSDIKPGELRQPKAIAKELTERSGLPISTRSITDLIKREGIQPRRVGNKTGYSLREVAAALGADTATLDRQDARGPTPVARADKILKSLAAFTRERAGRTEGE